MNSVVVVIGGKIQKFRFFHNACLKHLKLFGWTHIWSGKIQPYVADSERCPKTGGWENKGKKGRREQMKRLFLLEDDLSLINGLSFALKKQGYEITVARTTLEADALWEKKAWKMPYRRLHNTYPGTKMLRLNVMMRANYTDCSMK